MQLFDLAAPEAASGRERAFLLVGGDRIELPTSWV
jgi:hypothetical protein